MKQKDIALVMVVGFISIIVSIFVSKTIFVTPKNRQQSVEVVQSIGTSFTQPDNRYFNSSSFDPTQPITIGQNNNNAPFNGSSTQ